MLVVRGLIRALAFCGAILAVGTSAWADLVYAVSTATDQLLSIDTDTGVGTAIGSGLGVDNVRGLAFDTSGRLFGLGGSQLITIDRTTGVASVVASFTFPEPAVMTGLAVDPATGVMYGTSTRRNLVLSTPSQYLHTVNTSTAALSLVGPLGLSVGGGDLTFAPNGVLISAQAPYPELIAGLWGVSTASGGAYHLTDPTLFSRTRTRLSLGYNPITHLSRLILLATC